MRTIYILKDMGSNQYVSEKPWDYLFTYDPSEAKRFDSIEQANTWLVSDPDFAFLILDKHATNNKVTLQVITIIEA